MSFADAWTDEDASGDGCALFFGRYLKAANPDVPAGGKVLEIGCSEFDWLTPASKRWPDAEFTGVDWRNPPDANKRGPRAQAVHGNALDPDLFPARYFDLIVSLSAIEHMGLGHYNEDPLDVDGDTHAIANAVRWLKIGGWLLFDVPYNPAEYRVVDTSHREYNDDALWQRLWIDPLCQAAVAERAAGYYENDPRSVRVRWHGTYYCKAGEEGALIEKPAEPCHPFYYVGLAWQRVG